MDTQIRPEVAELIARAEHGVLIEVSEFENFEPPCTLDEADAMLPWLTNSSLARRIDRCLAHIATSNIPVHSYESLVLKLARESQKRLERL